MRVGHGFDVHRLVAGRPLIIGGVTIPFEKGLAGHSDADVLLHAICDALLGAAGLGDIGMYFPDTDPALEGVASTDLLRKVKSMVSHRGYRICNIDTVIVAQAPPMSPHRGSMQNAIALHLSIGGDRISIKATTTEGLGMTGNGEAIAAMATVLIDKKPAVSSYGP